MSNKILSTRKKFFKTLYLSNNKNDYILEIILDNFITYKDFFCLTKLIHSSFINYQFGIKNYLEKNFLSLFLNLNNNLNVSETLIDVKFDEFKKLLSKIKKYSLSNFKIIKDFTEVNLNNEKLNFIEELVSTDIRYKNSSIRQIKSHYIRQNSIYLSNFEKLDFTFNSSQLIDYYYNQIKDKWLLIPCQNLSNTIIQDNTHMTNMDQDLITQTDIEWLSSLNLSMIDI